MKEPTEYVGYGSKGITSEDPRWFPGAEDGGHCGAQCEEGARLEYTRSHGHKGHHGGHGPDDQLFAVWPQETEPAGEMKP